MQLLLESATAKLNEPFADTDPQAWMGEGKMKGDGGREGDSVDRRSWLTEVALSKCLGPSSSTDQCLDTRSTPYGAVFPSITHKTMVKSMTLLAVPVLPLEE